MKFLSKPTDSEGNTLATEKYVDKAVSSGSGGNSLIIEDTTNSKKYSAVIKLINGKPAIEYEEVAV